MSEGTEVKKSSSESPVFCLSKAACERLDEISRRYPSPKSAVLPALQLVQEQLGWISPEAMAWVAERLEIPESHVMEVTGFYTMLHRRPVGKYHIRLCRTLSCMLGGAPALAAHLRERFNMEPGEVSADGMWSYEEVECLGSCGSGPVVQINDVYFERMTPARLDEVLVRIEREQPDLGFSTLRGELGAGLGDIPRSQVWPPEGRGEDG